MLFSAIAVLMGRLRDLHDASLQVQGKKPHNAAIAYSDKVGHAQPEATFCY